MQASTSADKARIRKLEARLSGQYGETCLHAKLRESKYKVPLPCLTR
jgi:hypothetical protein